ncbi:exonuclease [Salmonella phage STWB21]|uniref:Exonuclease n=1 Tax=Salmonella phage STWB21 TaxID=2815768 RepID=A0A8A6RID3_9CAUD|nr:exonuclease [Salmonella phage STWB21]
MSKIIIKTLKFSNVMSYGKDIVIHFDKNPVTQLIGENGLGKSTIATVLEELFYNKNSRGIKKDALFSWSTPKKEYEMHAYFSKDEDEYELHKVVKSTAKVTLIKNGEDVSGHTATQTYKMIEEIMGGDFQTFTKLIYQSVGSNLDFLKATDATRKAFLVNLFNQEQYKEMSETIKTDRKEVAATLSNLQGQMAVITKILNGKDNLGSLQEPVEIPEFDEEPLSQELTESKVKAALAKAQEANITKLRNLDKAVQVAEKSFEPYQNLPAPMCKNDEITSITRDLTIVTSRASEVKKRYQKFKHEASATECPTCGTHLDTTAAQKAMDMARVEYDPLFKEKQTLESQLEVLKKEQLEYTAYSRAKDALDKAVAARDEFKNSMSDSSFEELNVQILQVQIRQLEQEIADGRSKVAMAKEHNSNVEVANARYKAKLEQIEKAEAEMTEITSKLDGVAEAVADLDILIAALKNLVGYKLEHSVKVFEELINKYLSIMTAGKFALGFELDETKLQVVIFNDGNRTSMENCSTGQQSRINLATLLAIRMLLTSISKVNINLLFLDEVISFIDTKGLDTLVELLNEEDSLNSIIVSHGHTHPLAHKITVKKDAEGFSYLE